MSQIIIIEDNKNLQELISLNLKTYVGAEIIPRESAADAIALLNILPTIDLVISRDQVKEESTANDIYEFLKQHPSETGLVVLGKRHKAEIAKEYQQVDDPSDWEQVVTAAAKVLGFEQDVINKNARPDYVPIPLKYFYYIDSPCCDVFLRIKKGPGDFQYVKRIHEGDSFSRSMLDKYSEQNLENFYIPKDYEKNFTNALSDQLVEKLGNSADKFAEDLPPETKEELLDEYIEQLGNSYSVALNEIKKLGFTSATIQLAESIINGVIKSANFSPEISTSLRKILNAKSSYLYQHCHLSSIVATEILKQLNMDTARNIEVITYASFFKDISFTDRPDLAKITSQEELEQTGLSGDDWALVVNHAAEGASFIRHHPEAPLDVDSVILTHHGSLDGKGFYSEKKDNVSELNSLQQAFMVSCEFVKELLFYRIKKEQPKPIMQELYKKFPQDSIRDVMISLDRVLKKRQQEKE